MRPLSFTPLSISENTSKLIKTPYLFLGLPISEEKFKCLTYTGYKILDSYSFLAAPLSQLSETLSKDKKKSGEKLKFLAESHLVKIDGIFNAELYELVQQKLTFPFQYASSRNKMEAIKKLPEKKYFLSTLSGKPAKQKDYDNVKALWILLELENLYQLYEYYCQLDVYLLAEVFNEFRKNCFR